MEAQIERSQSLAIRRLNNATFEGEVKFFNLLREDPLILDRRIIGKSRCFMESPLHVAAYMGHLEIIKTLLDLKANLCFTRNEDGMTPIHVAAVNGKTDALEMLLYHGNPHAARERTTDGETVLHLCIKHDKTKALELLLEHIDDELLNAKDKDGNTVLHLAVIGKQPKMVKTLLKHPRIEKNAINKNELTALDIHILLTKDRYKKDVRSFLVIKWGDDDEIGPSLENGKALRAKDALKIQNRNSWVQSQSNALMVVASLIATMAFTAGIAPPGGFWQETSSDHWAGDAVKGDVDPSLFRKLVVSNTIALISSLSVILLLISGLPYGRLFVGILRITMWIAITATTLTYATALIVTMWSGNSTYAIALRYWLAMMGAMICGHTLFFLVKFIERRPTLRARILKWVPKQSLTIISL